MPKKVSPKKSSFNQNIFNKDLCEFVKKYGYEHFAYAGSRVEGKDSYCTASLDCFHGHEPKQIMRTINNIKELHSHLKMAMGILVDKI